MQGFSFLNNNNINIDRVNLEGILKNPAGYFLIL